MKSIRPSSLRWGQAFILLALAAGIVLTALWVRDRHARLELLVEDVGHKHARLQGIVAADAAIVSARDSLMAQVATQVYASDIDITRAGNDAQQRIHALFSSANLSISSIQVLPPEGELPGLDTIPIGVQVEGDSQALALAVQVLAAGEPDKPRLLLRSMQLQSVGAVRPNEPVKLSGRFQFVTLKVKP